jgi:hypothetical protein
MHLPIHGDSGARSRARRGSVLVIAVVVATAGVLFGSTPAANAATCTGWQHSWTSKANQVWSANATFCLGRSLRYNERLTFQADGNLVLYDGAKAVWASSTAGRGKTLALQADGNMVIYAGSKALWNSHTNGTGSSSYIVQLGADTGNVGCWAESNLNKVTGYEGFWTSARSSACWETYDAGGGGDRGRIN